MFRLGILALGLSGCMEYRIETSLNPDGSGTRLARLEITDIGSDVDRAEAREQLVLVRSLSEERGWAYKPEVGPKGDTTHVFERSSTIEDLGEWSALTEEIQIHATRPAHFDSVLGSVSLGDVQLRNRVRVRSSGQVDGSIVFSFMESFIWDSGKEALVEAFALEMDRSVGEAFPNLTERERGTIFGITKSGLQSAIDDGILDSTNDDEDRIWEEVMSRAVSMSLLVVRPKYPSATEGTLRTALDILSGEYEGGDWFEELLPGLLSGTHVTYTLTMPGEVTTTNAHDRDGNTLEWEFSTDDAMAAPVVLVAESLVGGTGTGTGTE